MKAREADSLTFSTPMVGVISLMEWQFEAITTVAAASANPDLALLWMQQITYAKTWQELVDPQCFGGLGLKLAEAAMKVCPPDLRHEIQVLRQSVLIQQKNRAR